MIKIQYGVNLNSHPDAAAWGRPNDPQVLAGLQWTRFVFFLRGATQGPGQNNLFDYDSSNRPLEYDAPLLRAFEYYDPIINSYRDLGIRTLLVMIQDSFGGNVPWHPGSNGNWDEFARNFGDFCGKIAAHYRGKGVAYEIWNESDVPSHPNSSSVFVPAEHFAWILRNAANQIKANDPSAQIISGGLATGAENGVQYLQNVRRYLSGELPVDAIGVHPYGLYPPSGPKSHLTLSFGRLDEDSIRIYLKHFPNQEIWFTEFGVASNNPYPREHWVDIADYMTESSDLIQRRYSDQIPVVIWWSWSDQMRNGGLVDHAAQRKQPIYSRLFKLANAPAVPGHISLSVGVETDKPPILFITPIDDGTPTFIRSKAETGDDSIILKLSSHGEPLQVLEDEPTAIAKIGKRGEWIQVRTIERFDGFIAAWFVERHVQRDETRGANRALEFAHAPAFGLLPVQLQPQEIIFFNGFGPNNFAYDDHVNRKGAYKFCYGIHNGLDFGVPHGTPLLAADWGLVLHCSKGKDGSDIPFRAGPRTVTILYGKYLCIYGHMSKTDEVSPGDIVEPGQPIGLSGTAFGCPHLHFELREINNSYLKRLTLLIQDDRSAIRKWTEVNYGELVNAGINYFNPAYFFNTPLESYQWQTGKPLPLLDRDNNGYPEGVILRDGIALTYDLYTLSHYARGTKGSFWEGSQASAS